MCVEIARNGHADADVLTPRPAIETRQISPQKKNTCCICFFNICMVYQQQMMENQKKTQMQSKQNTPYTPLRGSFACEYFYVMSSTVTTTTTTISTITTTIAINQT